MKEGRSSGDGHAHTVTVTATLPDGFEAADTVKVLPLNPMLHDPVLVDEIEGYEIIRKAGSHYDGTDGPANKTAEEVYVMVLSTGTPILEGRVASQEATLEFGSYAVGGGRQVYVLDRERVIVPGVD